MRLFLIPLLVILCGMLAYWLSNSTEPAVYFVTTGFLLLALLFSLAMTLCEQDIYMAPSLGAGATLCFLVSIISSIVGFALQPTFVPAGNLEWINLGLVAFTVVSVVLSFMCNCLLGRSTYCHSDYFQEEYQEIQGDSMHSYSMPVLV